MFYGYFQIKKSNIMCLFINQLKPKIADKNIICYKLVKRTKVKGIYKSIFQKFEYTIKKLYINNISIECSNSVIKHFKIQGIEGGDYFIEEGMFHSYANCSHAVLNHAPDEFIVKCIIPKGAYYYKGYYGGLASYASSQIKILEEI